MSPLSTIVTRSIGSINLGLIGFTGVTQSMVISSLAKFVKKLCLYNCVSL